MKILYKKRETKLLKKALETSYSGRYEEKFGHPDDGSLFDQCRGFSVGKGYVNIVDEDVEILADIVGAYGNPNHVILQKPHFSKPPYAFAYIGTFIHEGEIVDVWIEEGYGGNRFVAVFPTGSLATNWTYTQNQWSDYIYTHGGQTYRNRCGWLSGLQEKLNEKKRGN